MHHKKYVKLAPNDYEVWSEWTLDYKQYEYPNDYEKVKKLIIRLLKYFLEIILLQKVLSLQEVKL